MLIRTFFFLVVFCFSIVCSAQGVGLNKVIAIVNNDVITLSEYQTRLNREQLQGSSLNGETGFELNTEILQLIINERIQAQQAIDRGIKVSEQEIDRTVTDIIKQNNSTHDDLYRDLSDIGISESQLRRSIEEQLLIQKIIDLAVRSRVKVSDLDVENYLLSHQELNDPDESYELSHLIITLAGLSESQIMNQQENLNSIRHNLVSDSLSFSEAVELYSDEEKADGGYLGWLSHSQLPDIFLDSFRETSINGITEIIRSENKMHLFKIHEKKGNLTIVTQNLIRHILINPERKGLTAAASERLALDIYNQIINGEDFAKMVRLNSDDFISAEKEGVLGWMNPGESLPVFEEAVNQLELHTLSKPLRTRFGYHLIEIQARREKDITQDLARQRAHNKVFQKKLNEFFGIWFDQIKSNAFIEIVSTN